MYFQLLIHNIFTDTKIAPVESEHDKALHTDSPVYEANKDLIDEYIMLDEIFTALVKESGKMTKFVNDEKTEQVVQIECSEEHSDKFLKDPRLSRFNELRLLVGWGILGYFFTDISKVQDTPTETYASFEDAIKLFY